MSESELKKSPTKRLSLAKMTELIARYCQEVGVGKVVDTVTIKEEVDE